MQFSKNTELKTAFIKRELESSQSLKFVANAVIPLKLFCGNSEFLKLTFLNNAPENEENLISEFSNEVFSKLQNSRKLILNLAPSNLQFTNSVLEKQQAVKHLPEKSVPKNLKPQKYKLFKAVPEFIISKAEFASFIFFELQNIISSLINLNGFLQWFCSTGERLVFQAASALGDYAC